MFSTYDHSKQNQKNYKLHAIIHSELNLNSTLFLAYRDMPEILDRNYFNVNNKKYCRLLDFGCGAGLSTQILSLIIKSFHLDVEIHGVDINEENLTLAKKRLSEGHFCKIDHSKSVDHLGTFDIVICNFVLLEHPYKEMLSILQKLHSLINDSGILIVTNCTSKVYRRDNKWYSFDSDFVENTPRISSKGKLKLDEDQPVKLQFRNQDTGGSFSFFDFYHSGRAYREAYNTTGFELKETHKPIGRKDDGIEWKDEAKHSPYKIHILTKNVSSKKNLIHIRSSL